MLPQSLQRTMASNARLRGKEYRDAPGYPGHVIFYVGVPDAEAALAAAERLGGKRQMGPERAPTGLMVGHFTDPEGNLIGVAGTA
ncbi:MAG: VOC family protein [Streptosporangiaceae bacterium]|nr:VOC family protein [Streptosporangiaceae bacterium]